MRKMITALLALVLTVSSLITMPSTVVQAEGEPVPEKIADSSTVNAWEDLFTDNSTEHAGGVWTDKSVFETANDYVSAINEYNGTAQQLGLSIDEDNFLVSLSAIAATKSIVGYSSIPTDTILVLDMSTSMINNRSIDELTIAANKAMQTLLSLNNHNRVGVVVYAGNTTGGFTQNAEGATVVLLPLDRYTATKNVDGDAEGTYDFLNYKKSGRNAADWNNMFIADGVYNSDNQQMSGDKTTSSGTFIQDGIYVGLQQFLRNDIETTIPEGQVQAGTERIPIMVIMTDGEPTLAVRDYDGNNGKLGANELKYTTHGYHDITFLSQLTASYAKQQIDNKYVKEVPLFYTLGLNVDEDEALVMNPDPSYENADPDLVARFNKYWDDLKSTGRTTLVDARMNLNYDVDTIKALEAYRSYSDAYYAAESEDGLLDAFEAIVKEIILQSMYYPTMADEDLVQLDGFVSFIDYVGDYMEVKSVKGFQMGDKLYNGSKLAQLLVSGAAGGVQNPTATGDNLVWALTERLGLVRGQDTQVVRDLLQQAYDAGQIAYNASTGEFSNHVGWFGDATGKYVGFWDGTEAGKASAPANAVAANKSYLFVDVVGEGHRETDILYASVQVSEAIKQYESPRGVTVKQDETLVYFALPASLIPLVEYHVELNDSNVMNPKSLTVTGADAPIRLLYEVGLSDEVDLLNLADTASDAKTDSGKYVFYTNQWNKWDLNNPLTAEPWEHNAYAMFEPSYENEHYYYNEKTQLFTDKNGTPATAYNSGQTYYHRHIIYTVNGSNVTATYEYQPVSSYVFDAEPNGELNYTVENNKVYIKKDVIKRYVADHTILKETGANKTETLTYSSVPFVHHEDASVYHIDDMLGNNGKLTLTQQEGIKLTKKIDATLTADSTEYEFVLKTDLVNTTLTLVKEDASSNRVYTTITFDANGEAKVTLKANETIYVLADDSTPLAGKVIVITETETKDVQVSHINGTPVVNNSFSASVEDDKLTVVEFTNTKVVTGDVMISKIVVSDHAAHKSDLLFDFSITAEGTNLKNSYVAELVQATETGAIDIIGTVERVSGTNYYAFTPDDSQYASVLYGQGVKLGHNDYLTIFDLPAGTKVKAVETPVAYFTTTVSDSDATVNNDGEVTVNVGSVATIITTNTYKIIENAEALFDLDGEKKVIGNSFGGGTFTFNLEYYDGTTWVFIKEFEAKFDGTQNTVEFGTAPGSLLTGTYTEAKDYVYRVVENVPADQNKIAGIVYDPVVCLFTVTVSDMGDGTLAVTNVTAGSDTDVTVTKDATNTYVESAVVSVAFENIFEVNGVAEAIFNLHKTVTNTLGDTSAVVSPANFVFGIYEANDQFVAAATPIKTLTTDALGNAVFNIVYDQNDAEGNYYYVIKENQGTNTLINYDTTEYHVTVTYDVVGSDPTLSVKVMKVTATGETQVYPVAGSVAEGGVLNSQVTVSGIEFENKYTPTPATLTVPISGVKHFEGWPSDVQVPDFTFELYESDSAGLAVSSTPVGTATVTGSDEFVFTGMQFERTGTYYYVVIEKVPAQANGISYDPARYVVTVKVTADAEGKLHAAIESITNNNNPDVIEFTNIYTVDSADLTLSGSKTLAGGLWTLNSNMFSFELYETDASYNVSGLSPIKTVTNGVNHNASAFNFELEYTQDDLNGQSSKTYYYVIKEVLPDAATAGNNYTVNGLTFDPSVYQIKVVVKDNGTGGLDIDKTVLKNGNSASNITFTNEYNVNSADVTIPGVKTVSGALMEAVKDQFKFDLYHAVVSNGTWSIDPANNSAIQTVTPDNDGKFEFGGINPLTFTKPGTYTFIAKEQNSSNPQVIEDTTIYHITVYVTDNLDGTLVTHTEVVAEGKSDVLDTVRFDNRVVPESVSVKFEGEKVLKGWPSDFTKDKPVFNYELYRAEANGLKIDENASTLEVDPVKVVSGNTAFVFENLPELTYSTPGTHYFVIVEQIPETVDENSQLKGITYDTTEYLLKVDVKLTDAVNASSKLDTLSASVTYYLLEGDQITEITADELVFNNEYKPETNKDVFLKDRNFSIDGRIVSYGDILTYKITYHHPESAETAAEVKIVDTLPEGVEYVEGSAKVDGVVDPTVVYSNGQLTWSLTNVAPDATVTVEFDVKVVAEAGAELENAAEIVLGGNSFVTNETYNSVVTDKDVVRNENGTLISIDGTPVLPNEVLTYQIRYVNTSTETVSHVTIEDKIPEGTEYVAGSASHNGVHSADTVTWEFTNVKPGESRVVTFQVKVVQNAAAMIENQAVVSISGNRYTTNEVFNYVIVKDVDKSHVNVGDSVVYTINYINYEETTADLTITDRLEEGLTVVSVENNGVYEAASHTIVWIIPQVPAGIKGTVSFTATINENAVDVVENKAVVQVDNNPEITTNVVKVSLLESVVLDAYKKLEGRPLTDGEFSFELYETDSTFAVTTTPVQTKKNDSNGYVLFDEIEFVDLGTYYFVVKESAGTLGGVTYDATAYHVTVTLTDGANGVDIATKIEKGTQTVDSMIFTNTYSLKDGAETVVVLKGEKHLTGRPWVVQDQFTFELYASDADYVVADNAVPVDTVTVDVNNHREFAFDELKYTAVGTHYFVMKEAAGTNVGIDYDDTVYKIQIKVSDDGQGNLVHQIMVNGSETEKPLFTNHYTITPDEFVLNGTKALNGRDLKAGEFKFVLYETNEQFQNRNKVADTINDASGNFQFTIEDKMPGKYYYIIEEEQGTLGGITYDKNHYHVTVEVVDDHAGSTTAIVTYQQYSTADGSTPVKTQAEFVNQYTVTDNVPLNITGSKVLTGRPAVNGEFTFELYETDDTYTVAAGATPVRTAVNKDGLFTFENLTYTAEGSYYYVVKEVKAGTVENGISYTTEVLNVKVIVTDNGNGEYVAKVVDNSDTEITNIGRMTNTYTPATTSVVLNGSKTLSGRHNNEWLATDIFSFELYSANDKFDIVSNVLATATVDASNKDFTFSNLDALKYSGQGTHYYVVKEVVGNVSGIIYDTTVFGVKVIVTDNLNGTLSTSVQYYADGYYVEKMIFDNFYEINDGAEVSVVLHGTKDLTGKELFDNEFKFELYNTDSTYDLATATKIAEVDNDSNIFTFPTLTYTKAMYDAENATVASFYYVVKEQTGTNPGVTYDQSIYKVRVDVTDNHDGSLHRTITITDALDQPVTGIAFHNKYEIKDYDPIVLSGTKSLTGRYLNAGEFTFVLYESDSVFSHRTKIAESTNAASGEFSFTVPTEGREPGNVYFVIEEQSGSLGGVTYDKSHYHIIASIEDNGSGKMEVNPNLTITRVVHDDEGNVHVEQATDVHFTNTYHAVDKNGLIISGVKELTGRHQIDGEFTFELYETDDTYVVADGASPIRIAYNTNDGFEFEELRYENAGKYYYVVKERKGTNSAITYDTQSFKVLVDVVDNGSGELNASYQLVDTTMTDITFKNAYAILQNISVVLNGEKTVEGRQWLTTDSFTFELYETDETYAIAAGTSPVQTATVDINNTQFSFTLDYDAENVHYYVVKEASGTIGGVTYDASEYRVQVTVVDNHDGTLTATKLVTLDDEQVETMKFVNTYKATMTKDGVIFTAVKDMIDRPLSENEFSFELYETDDTFTVASNPIEIVKNDTNGNVLFTELNYTALGTHYYVIKETAGTLGGITYDSSEIHVTVEVTDDLNGYFVATVVSMVKVEEGVSNNVTSITFVNKYKPAETSEGVVFEAHKVLNGKSLAENEFTFGLYEADQNYDIGSVAKQLKKNNAAGDVKFDEIKYQTAGTYYYVIKEINEGAEGMTYDASEYHIEVKVTDDYSGMLKAEIVSVKKSDADVVEIEFINEYTKPVVPEVITPNTGDDSTLAFWSVTSFTSLMLALLLLLQKKRFIKNVK